jgi:O-antigen ligase
MLLSVHNPKFSGEVLNLPPSTREANVIELDLRATNRGAAEVLVLDRLTFSSGPLGPPYPGPRYAYWALGGLAGLLAMPLIGRRLPGPIIALALALIVGAATDLRMSALVFAAHHVQPNPDTISYQVWADQFRWWPPNKGLFCGCFGPREPVWIAAGHLASQLFGSATFHLRATTTLLSVGVVVLAIAAGRRRLSWAGALAVGILVALNGNIISNATRGLRTELEMASCLILYLLLDRDGVRHALRNATAAGLVGAALVLTRSFFLPVVIVMDGISLITRYRPVKQLLMLLVVAVGLPLAGTVGHRLAMYELPYTQYGGQHNPFLDTDSYARWSANYEKFIYGRDLPHPELFQTREEYLSCGLYCGPHITYFQFLFVLHTPQQVLLESLAGYVDIVQNTGGMFRLDPWQLTGDSIVPASEPPPSPGYWLDTIVRYLGVVGLVAMLVTGIHRRRDLLVPGMYLGILGFATFLYHRKLIEPYYNVIQAWPFMFIAGFWALERAVRFAWENRHPERPTPLPPVMLAPFAATALLVGISLAAFPGYPLSILTLLAGIAAAAVAAACLIDAATGAVVLVATLVLLPGEGMAAGVAVAGWAALLIKLRPPLRLALPAAAAGPFALGAALSGIGAGTWRPHLPGLEMAVLVMAVTSAMVVVSASPERRRELLHRLPLILAVLIVCVLLASASGRSRPIFASTPGTLLVATLPALAAMFGSWRWRPLLGAGLGLALSAAVALYTMASAFSGGVVASSLWPAVLRVAAAHPVFGVGIGHLATALREGDPGLGPGLTAHNEFLQAAAEAGLVGLAGLLMLIAAAAVAALRRAGQERRALVGAVAILVLMMTVQSVLTTAPGIVGSLTLLGLALGGAPTRSAVPGGDT